MATPTWRATLTFLWRARHILRDPWEEVESVLTTFRIGIAALASTALWATITLIALLVALLADTWRTHALLAALLAATLATASLILSIRLLLITLPRRVRELIAWLANAPTHLQSTARELARIAEDVQNEDAHRRH